MSQYLRKARSRLIFVKDLISLVPVLIMAVPIVILNVVADRLSTDKYRKSRVWGIDW